MTGVFRDDVVDGGWHTAFIDAQAISRALRRRRPGEGRYERYALRIVGRVGEGSRAGRGIVQVQRHHGAVRAGGGRTGDFDVVIAGNSSSRTHQVHCACSGRNHRIRGEALAVTGRNAAGGEGYRIGVPLDLPDVNVESGVVGYADILGFRRGGNGEVRVEATTAGRDAEDANARVPHEGVFRHVVVLIGVPEGALVYRINRHGAIVTPAAIRSRVHARAFHNRGFRLHGSQRVAIFVDGVANGGFGDSGIGDAVAEGDVTGAIHGNTAHPTVGVVRPVGAFLVERPGVAAFLAQLEPADGGLVSPIGVNGDVANHGLIGAEVAILQAHHGPPGE